jgi:uncharacterized protein (DUF1499 family)
MTRKLLLAVGILAAIAAVVAWPRINDVETGRTPEYPDLTVREYSASPDQVAKAVEQSLARLPRWTLVGSGKGPMGSEVAAVHQTLVFRFKDDVTVKIRREGPRTKVSVRSHSRLGKWDFGQNARNVRELLGALDQALR